MSFLIGNARIDENSKASGGSAGDQTGKEVQTQAWYSYPWNCVVRAKDSTVAEKIARSMELACQNQNIGYDQSQRTTLYTKVKALGFTPESLGKVDACETDCSALVAVCVCCAGISVSPSMWTGNEAELLVATGQFEKLTDAKYTSGYSYLKRGDILINTVHHTAIALGTGTAAGSTGSTASTSSGSTKYVAEGVQVYKNGSTSEPVYQTPDCTTKIGSLNPYEECFCSGKVNGVYLVTYTVDNKTYNGNAVLKAGFVKYAGGCSF